MDGAKKPAFPSFRNGIHVRCRRLAAQSRGKHPAGNLASIGGYCSHNPWQRHPLAHLEAYAGYRKMVARRNTF